jgi:hypothetical protein
MRPDEPRSRDGYRSDGALVSAGSQRQQNRTRAPPIRFRSLQEVPDVRRPIGVSVIKEDAS